LTAAQVVRESSIVLTNENLVVADTGAVGASLPVALSLPGLFVFERAGFCGSGSVPFSLQSFDVEPLD
jgi:hypothetical protein